MSLDKTEIEQIATLAKLKITQQDIQDYQSRLSRIVELVKSINDVNTTDITPLAHPLEIEMLTREDEVTEIDQRDLLQSQAPLIDNHYYLVPTPIKKPNS